LVLRRLWVPGAWFAAALFAVHPVHVESVAWPQERKNVLSGVFYFAACAAYLRYAFTESEAADTSSMAPSQSTRIRAWAWYMLALIGGLCAFLSKTATCTLPAALALVLWWRRGRLGWRDLVALLPLFVLAVGSGLMTVWVEKAHVGAEGEDWALSPVARCLVAGRALWFYAAELVWPAQLTFIYPRWHIDTGAWWQYLFPLTAASFVATLWLLRRRIGTGPLAAVLFFAGTLVPVLGFVNFYFMRLSFVADHLQYLPSV